MAQTIEELREMLIEAGHSAEEVAGLRKSELRDMVNALESASAVLDGVVTTDEDVALIPADVVTEEENSSSNKPKITDKDWTQYVLGLFSDDEIDKQSGMPRADGLRRVATLELGAFDILSRIVQTPNLENGGRSVVTVRLEFDSGRVIEGSADVDANNTKRSFAIHSVATAETRAEGRALRKALRLTKVLAAEELEGPDQDQPDDVSDRVMGALTNSLIQMGNKIKVDPLKTAIKEGFDIISLDDLTHKQALIVFNRLSEYNRKKEEIPDEVKS